MCSVTKLPAARKPMAEATEPKEAEVTTFPGANLQQVRKGLAYLDWANKTPQPKE